MGTRPRRPSWKWASAAAASLVIGLTLAVVASSLAAGTAPAVITGGQTLTAGQSLGSADGHYQLTMQSDGNLVESITGGSRVIWSSGTSGNPGATAVLQPDGDLVVEDPSGDTLWSSNASTPGACPALNVLNDGNVEVDGASGPVWSTGEVTGMSDGDDLESGQVIYSPNYEYYLTMQGDGNLVLYNSSSGVVWTANTEGNPGAYAILQSDGNFVVYGANGAVLWQAATDPSPGDRLFVQTDGNLVIYPASGAAVWASNTSGASPGTGSIQPQPQLGSSVACPAAPPPTPTVTVTVATTTVLTVTTSPTRTKLPKVKVPVAFHWTWADAYSYLRGITFGRIPANLNWLATVKPARKGARARTYRAITAKQRHALLLALEGQRYTQGERVTIELARAGYAAETATFEVRYHRVPELVG